MAVGIYSLSLVAMFVISTCYHAVAKKKLKTLFRKLDHISIYLLIAGTYTPVLVIAFPNDSGLLLLYLIWGIALFGCLMKVFFFERFDKVSLLLYLIMGWLIVLELSTLQENTTPLGRTFLIGGGVSYTIGAVFYALERIRLNHFIWHLFVLAGSIFHFLFIFFDVVENQS